MKILSDPKKKELYDQYGQTDSTPEPEQRNMAPSRSVEYQYRGSTSAEFDPNEIFQNIFSRFGRGHDFFGNQSGAINRDVEVRRRILHYFKAVVRLTFLESVLGARKSVKITRLEQCESCGGKGVAKGSKMTSCKACRGTGRVSLRT